MFFEFVFVVLRLLLVVLFGVRSLPFLLQDRHAMLLFL